jgi:hypothetical protein
VAVHPEGKSNNPRAQAMKIFLGEQRKWKGMFLPDKDTSWMNIDIPAESLRD